MTLSDTHAAGTILWVETKRALILPEQESELRADDENRTRTICLEGRGSTIELHPRAT